MPRGLLVILFSSLLFIWKTWVYNSCCFCQVWGHWWEIFKILDTFILQYFFLKWSKWLRFNKFRCWLLSTDNFADALIYRVIGRHSKMGITFFICWSCELLLVNRYTYNFLLHFFQQRLPQLPHVSTKVLYIFSLCDWNGVGS